MHYHAGIHAERYFRFALGMQTPDPADVAEAVEVSARFLDTARAGIEKLRQARLAGE
jgi:predicted deacylase